MNRLTLVVLFVLVAGLPGLVDAQTPPVRERLGARGGAVFTSGNLSDSYGNGGTIILHFAERIYNSFFLDVHIGAIYMGDLRNTALDDSIFVSQGIVSEMRFLYFSIGPEYARPVGERSTAYLAAGVGIYSVSVVLDDPGVQAFNFSDQHFGFNTGLGYMYRFTDNWNLDLNLSMQYIHTTAGFDDLYFVFTEGGTSPIIVEAGIGVMIDLR